MTYNAFVLQEQDDPNDNEHVFGLRQWMVWVQSPAGAWLLLQGGWPTATSALRFIDRTGYKMIDSKLGLKQLDKQLEERARTARSTLTLRSVH